MKLTLALLLLVTQLSLASDYIRITNNNNNPIKIILTIDRESFFEFDFNIEKIAKSNSILDKLNAQFVDNRLWLNPGSDFEIGKLLVKDDKQQIKVILLLSASSSITPQSYKISSQHKPLKIAKQTKQKTLSYVDLSRFLAQKLYAPQRLIKDIGLHRVFINKNSISLFSCGYSLACNGAILATPIMQYTNGRHYVIAIKLVNQTQRVIYLDPRDIIGNYLSATFQFNTLMPAGTSADTTVVYLINDNNYQVNQ